MTELSGFETYCYLPQPVQVKTARAMTQNEIFLDLDSRSEPLPEHRPGQFIELSVPGIGEVPISICSSPTHTRSYQLCIRQAGNVTAALQKVKAGDWLAYRGPFGKGFPLTEMRGRDLLILAGGLGIAPLRSLIQYVIDRRQDFNRVTVIYGTQSPATRLFVQDLAAWQSEPHLELFVTVDEADDTWDGRTGVATEPLRDLELNPEHTLAAVVGPPILFRFAAMELFAHGLDESQIFFSLERNFHCGIGKCGHCQLNDLYVCQDGPVFRFSKLLKRIEAIETWAPDKDQDV